MKKIYLLIILIILNTNLLQAQIPWVSYYGASLNDQGNGIATDNNGNVYIVGTTNSTTAIATSGSHQSIISGSSDAFIVKFDKNGVRIWATYFGGTGYEEGNDICIDSLGNVFITGSTGSSSGIATSGSHQSTINGSNDAFIAKFNSNGLMQWATYFGGTGSTDAGIAITCDNNGSLAILGYTSSSNGIATSGAHQTSIGGGTDVFVAKFNTMGTLQWSTYYGGSASEFNEGGITFDKNGNIIIAGTTFGSTQNISSTGAFQTVYGGNYEAFMVKFNAQGLRRWGTYHGGNGNEMGNGVATDTNGNIYLTALVSSENLATIGAHKTAIGNIYEDAIIVKFDSTGNRQWATYFGGNDSDCGSGITVSSSGNIFITGYTYSTSNISTIAAYQTSYGGGQSGQGGDAFVAKFNTLGVLQWSSYLGGGGYDWGNRIAIDKRQNVYLTGYTNSTNNIATIGTHQTIFGSGTTNDAFIAAFASNGGYINPYFTSTKVATYVTPKYKLPINLTVASQGEDNMIVGYKYYFDKDSVGAIYSLLNTPKIIAHIIENININPSVLDTGFHTINLQIKDSLGLWSNVVTKQFRINGKAKLTKIVTNKGGNGGDVTVNIYGDGFYENTKVKLAKGTDTIYVADSLMGVVSGNRIIATLALKGKAIGFYDLIVELPELDTTLVLKNGFEVILFVKPSIWTQVIGPSSARRGTPSNYSILYGNKGNCDIIGVPVFITITGNPTIKIKSSISDLNGVKLNSPLEAEIDNNGVLSKGLMFLIPRIPPNTTTNIIVEVILGPEDVGIKSDVSNPILDGEKLITGKSDCFEYLIEKAVELDLSQHGIKKLLIEDVIKCVGGSIKFRNESYEKVNSWNKISELSTIEAIDIGSNLGSTAVSCASVVFPEVKALKILGKVFKILKTVAHGVNKCNGEIELNENSDSLIVKSVQSLDPNDKLGPFGFNSTPYFNPSIPFSYQIRFENVDSATAPAQQVIIIDTLDKSVFDLTTFKLGMVTVGDTIVSFSPGLSKDSMYVDLSDKGINATVKIKGSLDTITGIATWVFDGLDPETLLPITDALGGFLPPNKNAPEGEGSVFYTIDLKKNLPNNTNIKNKAYIYFDANPAIITPEWKNVLDIVKPTSKVDSLSTIVTDSLFTVKWSGNDVGSGVVSYSIYYKVNNGNYNLWLANTSEKSAVFNGSADSTYSFYSIARDSALNIEDAPIIYDAKTTVRVSTGIANSSLYNNSIYTKVYPNPANESFTVKIYNERASEYEISIVDLMGKTLAKQERKGANSPEFIINTDDLNNGIYFIVISNSENTVYSKHKIVVMKK